jgi:hypothetical protein
MHGRRSLGDEQVRHHGALDLLRVGRAAHAPWRSVWLVFDWQFWNARTRASVDRLHAKPAPAAA